MGIATCFSCFTAYTLSTQKEVLPLIVYLDAVALLGAAYAVLVYLPGLNFLRVFPFKLLTAAGMLLCAFGWKRSTVRLGAVFGAVTLVLCGAVYGVELIQGQALQIRKNALFFPVSFFSLLLTAAAVAMACRLLLPRLTHSSDSIVPVKLSLCGRCVHLSALKDSGNTLCDPVSGAKVLTVYWKAARGLFPPEIGLKEQDFAAPATLPLRMKAYAPRLIPYRAVGTSSGILFALPCKITLEHTFYTGLVAFSPTPVSDGGAYDALTGGN